MHTYIMYKYLFIAVQEYHQIYLKRSINSFASKCSIDILWNNNHVNDGFVAWT